jgi:hypothetical protein
VTASLTSVLPALAPSFGLTPQALYERKRALIKLGMLPSPQGRGRRGGAAAAPDTIALLLIAVMVTGSLSEMDGRVKKLAAARFQGQQSRRCPITGASTFHEAITFLLSEKAPISRESDTLLEITVSRSKPTATISYFAWPARRDTLHTEFGPQLFDESVMSANAELRHAAFLTVREVALASIRET